MQRTLGGFLLGFLALVTCPCHLLVTAPLLIAALAGTPLGSWLGSHPEWLFLWALVVFCLSLVGAIQLLGSVPTTSPGIDPGEQPSSRRADRCCPPLVSARSVPPSGREHAMSAPIQEPSSGE